MDTRIRIRLLQVFAHLGALSALFIHESVSWYYVLCAYFVYQGLGVGAGLHRYFSHRSFKANIVWQWFFGLLGCSVLFGSPLTWASIHRFHHQISDTEADPHSPKWKSYFSILTGQWYDNVSVSRGFMRDLLADPVLVWTHRHYFTIVLAFNFFFLLLGIEYWVYLYCLPVVAVYHMTNIGLIFNHVSGYQNFNTRDESRNTWWISVLTFGEGWHNNHHAHPQQLHQGERWWEFDLVARFVGLIQQDAILSTQIPEVEKLAVSPKPK